MKRVLAVLLAACLLCGGLAVGAGAAESGPNWADKVGVLTTVLPVLVYWEGGTLAEIEAGLLPAKDINVLAGEAAWTETIDFLDRYNLWFGLVNVDALFDAYTNGALQADVEQVLPALKALFDSYFTPAFIDTFNAYRDAFVRGYAQQCITLYHFLQYVDVNVEEMLAEGKEVWIITNLEEFRADIGSFSNWFDVTYKGNDGLGNTGTYAELTAFWLEVEARAKAIEDKIEYTKLSPTDPVDPTDLEDPEVDKIYAFFASFLHEPLAKALTFIVK